ncbi:hypothetical protein AnigIFM56816_009677 [Aspergillus niger]|nr:hypothetical protein AnigIFM56816_009677 [Aspergillus niger]
MTARRLPWRTGEWHVITFAALAGQYPNARETHQGPEMGKTGANDGHGWLNSGPDKQRSHHPSNITSLSASIENVNAYGTGYANAAMTRSQAT